MGEPRRRASLALALLAALPAPVRAIVAGMPPDSPAARVDANRPDSPFAGVGSISVLGDDGHTTAGVYSGCLIAPRWAVTAGHVVAGKRADQLNFNLNLSETGSQTLPVRRVVLHPNFHVLPNQRYADDIALLELAEAAPRGTPAYPLATDPPRPGAALVLVGYGASGSGAGGAALVGRATVKRVAVNAADAMETVPPLRLPQTYLFDFDHPLSGGFLGGPSLGNAREGTLAAGDSGSPALLRGADGRWRLAGVNTFVFGVPGGAPPPQFGSGGGGILIAPYAAWINDTLGARP